MSIDWSKAPEGAEYYSTASELFYRDGPEYFEKYSLSRERWVAAGGERHEYIHLLRRPDEWNGQGLPPVGTVCEWMHHQAPPASNSEWRSGDIRYISDCTVIIGGNGCEHVHHPLNCSFRPVRTPEQIAAEERIAEINEMLKHIRDWPSGSHGVNHLSQLKIHEDACCDLYDAGYRKQVQP